MKYFNIMLNVTSYMLVVFSSLMVLFHGLSHITNDKLILSIPFVTYFGVGYCVDRFFLARHI